MERLKSITIIFLLAVGLLTSVAPAKTTSVLLQEGLYAEEITGDLDAAIKIYEQVISESKKVKRAAAQATYRIGMCFLKKGEKSKAAEQFRNLMSKYPDQKTLVARSREQLKKLGPPKVGGFGPVMERVINDDGEEKHWLIDFDTGKLFSHSTEIRSEEALLRWIAENQIDAMGETRASGPGLYGFDMAVIPIAAETWQTISPKGLTDDLSITKGGTPAVMSAMGKLPVTYIFKTREGGMGIVQILEMQHNKKPRHFRIRYKMLKKLDVRGLSVSSRRRLLDERTLIAINRQDRFGAKWFKVEGEYEAASQSKKQQMIEKWMADAQKPDVTIRSSAIASLGNISCKQAADVLMKIAKEPMEFSRSNRPRWIAVRSLGRVGDMRAVPVLIDLLDYYNKDTQLYSKVALCEITGVYFGNDKAKWRKWWQQKGKPTVELDLSTPEATVISFTKAAIAGDVESAMACFSPGSHDYGDVKELLTSPAKNFFKTLFEAVDPSAPIATYKKKQEGDWCEINWTMKLKKDFKAEGQTFKAGQTFELDGNLKKVEDRWLIVGI